jgi:hypothetical protein
MIRVIGTSGKDYLFLSLCVLQFYFIAVYTYVENSITHISPKPKNAKAGHSWFSLFCFDLTGFVVM